MIKALNLNQWTPAPHVRDPLTYFAGDTLRIGNRTQLLAFSGIVEDSRGTVRRVTPPMRHPEPILVADRPWEGGGVFRATIMNDEDTGRLRMWYHGETKFHPVEGGVPRSVLLYAESENGLRWEKPLLDIISSEEHSQTNVLYRGGNNNCSAKAMVFDPNEKDPSRKYKLLHKGAKSPDGAYGQDLAFSPDGLNWRPYEGNPVMPYRHDCNVNLLYDTSRRIWTAFVRPYAFSTGFWPEHKKGHFRRRIAICESEDLMHWSKVRTVIAPEEGDENEFDHIEVLPYGDVLVGMLGIFEEPPEPPLEQRMHFELAISDDGRRWERVPGKQRFLSPTGAADDFDRDTITLASSAALIDGEHGEILLYYNGSSWDKGEERYARSAIGLLHVRKDRFIEQHAGPEGGWLLTREFVLEGDSLEVNCKADGALTVELAEYPGQAIAGFALNECDPIRGDHLAKTVAWKGNRDLSRLRGKPIYIRFNLKETNLWSFIVRDSGRR